VHCCPLSKKWRLHFKSYGLRNNRGRISFIVGGGGFVFPHWLWEMDKSMANTNALYTGDLWAADGDPVPADRPRGARAFLYTSGRAEKGPKVTICLWRPPQKGRPPSQSVLRVVVWPLCRWGEGRGSTTGRERSTTVMNTNTEDQYSPSKKRKSVFFWNSCWRWLICWIVSETKIYNATHLDPIHEDFLVSFLYTLI